MTIKALVTPRQIIASTTYDRFKGLCPDCKKLAIETDKRSRPNVGYNQFSPNFMFGGEEFTAIEGETIRLLIANHNLKPLKGKELAYMVYGPTLYDTGHSMRQCIYVLRHDGRLERAGYQILGRGSQGYRMVNTNTDDLIIRDLKDA